jgi:hypothetical protein
MPHRASDYAGIPATVHSWSLETANETFGSFEMALDYCRLNSQNLPAIEVFVHNGQMPEPIVSGGDLEALLKSKRCHN